MLPYSCQDFMPLSKLFHLFFFSCTLPIPAPKHKPSAIHKPTLSVILPIIIPASKPIAAPIDVLDSFITLIYLKSVGNEITTYLCGLEVAELTDITMVWGLTNNPSDNSNNSEYYKKCCATTRSPLNYI